MHSPFPGGAPHAGVYPSLRDLDTPNKMNGLMNGLKKEGMSPPISEYFGEATFGLGEMRERLHRDTYIDLIKALDQGRKLSVDTANSIAVVIKEWAVAKGATHFCHWFQPMTGLTAEKHDAFISIQHVHHSDMSVIEHFTGTQLIQGEPDASSFPSGGMRSTFEARGYTAWDPTSALFIVEGPGGTKTLCIPSVFFGYHGEALDNKTPLLRSVQSLSKQACAFLKAIGDVDAKSVTATLGAEQEYFLVDKELAAKRPDLLISGRTLLGAPSIRGQKLEDHYFGSIPTRVKAFMEDLERELYRLGVPIKTRHNEVAPSQFEMAPIFESAAVSADHNTLAMETMKRVAARHGLLCLLHEKPFAEVNGNGKHCNWSMQNDKGENLLEPGRTPHQNLRFLAMVAIVLRAVHDHADVLGAIITSPGNDLRLGGNEAPPTIISAFLGSMLEGVFASIEKGEAARATEKDIINLGINHIPSISRDHADRNRTSPFCFTGNKFEFRAVGASANIAVPISILNAAVAESFGKATERLQELLKAVPNRDEAVMKLIREIMTDCSNVLFTGDNYSPEWREEAKSRGLPIVEGCTEAFPILRDKKAMSFLIDMEVLSWNEIISRHNVKREQYTTGHLIDIETLCEMCREFVIPAVESQLIKSYKVESGIRCARLKNRFAERVAELEGAMDQLLKGLEDVEAFLESAADLEDDDLVKHVVELGLPRQEMLRAAADRAEATVSGEYWTLPKYRDLLFHHSMR